MNLRTRLPFDQKGLVIAGNVKASYGDRSKKWTPEFSGLISDTWDTEVGRFGLLADYAWSHVVTRTESVIMDKIDTYCSAGATGLNNQAIIGSDGTIPCTSNVFGGNGWAFAPDGVRYSRVDYDRHRRGLALAAQYESLGGNFRATVQYLDSKYHNAWIEHASHAILDGSYFGTPAFDPRTGSVFAGSSGLTFGSNGMLTGGLLTQPHGSWLNSWNPNLQADINTGSAIPGVPFVNDCAIPGACATFRDGLYFQNESRDFDHHEGTKDLSANIKWDISPRVHLNLDAQHITASTFNNDILVATGSITGSRSSRGMSRTIMPTKTRIAPISNMISREEAGLILLKQASAMPTGIRRFAIRRSIGLRLRPAGIVTAPASTPTILNPTRAQPATRTSRAMAQGYLVRTISAVSIAAASIPTARSSSSTTVH